MSLKASLQWVVAACALMTLSAQAKESNASTDQVQCKDGTFSSAKGRGACSGHGGVLKASTADDAKAKASSAANDVKSTASSTANDAKAKASSTADDAKAKASSTADDAKAKASSTADDAKAKASSTADDAKAKASTTAQDVKSKASSAADDAKTAKDDTVICKDGTTSKAGRGACSRHGGVVESPTQAGRPPAPTARTGQPGIGGSEPSTAPAPGSRSTPSAPTAGTPTAKCKDGTFSYAKQHEGACSHHGGVGQWLDTNK